jgi:diguanylate cyclase (GGDEF)-like protein
VRYSALDPGAYQFELSCGSDEVGWSLPATYSFVIQAPWWIRWWAITMFILSLTGVLYALARYRSRLHRKEREALEAAVTERSAELAKANRELQEASLRDPLTGVRNRRFFHATIPADASQAIRAYRSDQTGYSTDHRDLVFFFIDIDYFKEVNDQYGHDAGDQVLVEVARRLDRITRTSDFLIRWGGEEFLLVCRSANRDEAYILAGRVLTAIANEPFDTGTGYSIQMTCSVGWAPFPWSLGSILAISMDHVLRLADRGLYMAKRRGRNQAVGLLPPDATPAHPSGQKLNIEDERMVCNEISTVGPKVETIVPGPVSR